MNFTSPLFLFGFPLLFLLYTHCAPEETAAGRVCSRQNLLLAASWLFYLGGSPRMFPLLLAITLITYAGGLAIEKSSRGQVKSPRAFPVLLAVLVLVLGILFVFKYYSFAAGEFLKLLGSSSPAPALPLPAGISFYTFQSLAYCIDVYRGTIPAERSLRRYALFVSFFPQLVAGPIERASALLPQLAACPTADGRTCREGAFYILRGFFKKIVIADFLSPYVSALFDAPLRSGPVTLTAGILFGFQIYADFSGYSDIAVGAAGLLGIRLSKNFDSPFLAQSPRDFWRRWHRTLTRWFTDYVYIPLGGNRHGRARHLLNILLVFFLSGLWHGAAWHFAAWGLFHGILVILSPVWDRIPDSLKPLKIGLTFLMTSLGWILFRASTLPQAGAMYAALSQGWAEPALVTGILQLTAAGLMRILLIPVLLYLLRELPEMFFHEETGLSSDSRNVQNARITAAILCTLIAAAWIGNLGSGIRNAFIYFQF